MAALQSKCPQTNILLTNCHEIKCKIIPPLEIYGCSCLFCLKVILILSYQQYNLSNAILCCHPVL